MESQRAQSRPSKALVGLEIRLLDGEVVTGALSATLRQQVRQHSRASKVSEITLPAIQAPVRETWRADSPAEA